jgi:Ni/Co efflux regulator RcnB
VWRTLTAVALILSATNIFADPPKDANLEEHLDKARKSFDRAKEDAKKSLLAAFEKEEEAVQANKSLSGEQKLIEIEKLRDEKKSFQDGDKLPATTRMKSAVEAYQRGIGVARKDLQKALDVAIEGYIKLDNLDAAKAVLAEKKAIGESKPAVIPKPEPSVKKPEPAAPAGLLGKWDVRLGDFRTQWTFEDGGIVKSTEGEAKTGKWKVERDKKRILITWDGTEHWDVLRLPVDPKSNQGQSSHNQPLVVVKLKE